MGMFPRGWDIRENRVVEARKLFKNPTAEYKAGVFAGIRMMKDQIEHELLDVTHAIKSSDKARNELSNVVTALEILGHDAEWWEEVACRWDSDVSDTRWDEKQSIWKKSKLAFTSARVSTRWWMATYLLGFYKEYFQYRMTDHGTQRALALHMTYVRDEGTTTEVLNRYGLQDLRECKEKPLLSESASDTTMR